jgi:hypothetical protein
MAASNRCNIKGLSEITTRSLNKLLKQRRKYCPVIQDLRGVNLMWTANNTTPLLENINNLSNNQKAKSINALEFSTLYTKIDHEDLKIKTKDLSRYHTKQHTKNQKQNTFHSGKIILKDLYLGQNNAPKNHQHTQYAFHKISSSHTLTH